MSRSGREWRNSRQSLTTQHALGLTLSAASFAKNFQGLSGNIRSNGKKAFGQKNSQHTLLGPIPIDAVHAVFLTMSVRILSAIELMKAYMSFPVSLELMLIST